MLVTSIQFQVKTKRGVTTFELRKADDNELLTEKVEFRSKERETDTSTTLCHRYTVTKPWVTARLIFAYIYGYAGTHGDVEPIVHMLAMLGAEGNE